MKNALDPIFSKRGRVQNLILVVLNRAKKVLNFGTGFSSICFRGGANVNLAPPPFISRYLGIGEGTKSRIGGTKSYSKGTKSWCRSGNLYPPWRGVLDGGRPDPHSFGGVLRLVDWSTQ